LLYPIMKSITVWKAAGCLHNCGWQGGKHSHTSHPHHLVIQHVLCKHGSHTPVSSASVLPAWWAYTCCCFPSMVAKHLLFQQVLGQPSEKLIPVQIKKGRTRVQKQLQFFEGVFVLPSSCPMVRVEGGVALADATSARFRCSPTPGASSARVDFVCRHGA
jgi:hypothetical protein